MILLSQMEQDQMNTEVVPLRRDSSRPRTAGCSAHSDILKSLVVFVPRPTERASVAQGLFLEGPGAEP